MNPQRLGDRTIASRPIVVSLARDIALNASIPTACYLASKQFVSPSEVTALLIASTFPMLKSTYELLRQRALNPVTVTVLLGIATGLLAFLLGGGPRMLLIRESLFTGAFGVVCLISLACPRPIMFYFGRHFVAGRDPEGRAIFDARAKTRTARRGLQLVTAVWGILYVVEFATRVIFAYTLPAALVLSISPFMTGIVTILAIVWTFRYRGKILASQGADAYS